MYGFELYNVKIKKNIEIFVNTKFNEFPRKNNQKKFIKDFYEDRDLQSIPNHVYKEFPNNNQFYSALYSTGIVFDKDHGHFFGEILNEIKKLNLLKGDLPIALAFDASTYRNHIFAHFYKYYKKNFSRAIKNLDFFVSKGVISELGGYEEKYEFFDLEKLTELAVY